MKFSKRQKQIIEIVKENEPISGDSIAQHLGLTKSTLRSDFAVLTMTGILDARQKVGYIYSGMTENSLLAESLTEYPIKDVMIQPIIVKSHTTVLDAITQLFMFDAGTLYIVDQETEKLTGLVSRKDLLRSILGQNTETALAVIMTRMPNIIVAQAEQSILEAAQLLSQHQIDSLPIVTPDYKVIGKITKSNIVDFLVDLCNSEE